MRSNRRQFVKSAAMVAACVAIPTVAIKADPADWDGTERELNTFSQDDTPEVRLQKFNALTGLSLTLGAHWLISRDPCEFGERCLMDGGKHYTGPMNEETFRHWTAQVALGYRIAKAQQG